MSPIDRAKQVIKNYLSMCQGMTYVGIPISNAINLLVFQKALKDKEIQEIISFREMCVNFYIPQNQVCQCINHMLRHINKVDSDSKNKKIIFPYYAKDYDYAVIALNSPEVQYILKSKNLEASIERLPIASPKKIINRLTSL